MKNRLYLVCGVLLVAAALGGLLWWAGRYVLKPLPPEPIYGGLVETSTPKSEMDRFFGGGHPEPVYEVHPLGYWLTRRYNFPMGHGVIVTSSGPPRDPLPTNLLNDSNAVPFLIKALRRDSWVGQAYYRKWLWPKLPPRIKTHLPGPAADNPKVRENAAGFLSRMGPMAEPSIPALCRALKEDESHSVRQMAVVALGYLGNGDRQASAALQMELQETNRTVRFLTMYALISIDPAAAANALTAALRDSDREFRVLAMNALLKLDPEAAAKAGVKPPSR
jgi:hypothetical protein